MVLVTLTPLACLTGTGGFRGKAGWLWGLVSQLTPSLGQLGGREEGWGGARGTVHLPRSQKPSAQETQQPEHPAVTRAEAAVGWPEVEEVRQSGGPGAWSLAAVQGTSGAGVARGGMCCWGTLRPTLRSPPPRPWCACSSGRMWMCCWWPPGRS